MTIDLSTFEEDHIFRTELLFFLKQAGNYIAQIFRESYNDKPKSRQLVYELVAKLEQERSFDKILKSSIVPDKEGHIRPVLDPYKKDFLRLLGEFPDHRRAVFAQRLHRRHGLAMTFNNFKRAVEQLLEKRHYLEHFEERSGRKKEFSDEDVIEALGIFLLPGLHPQITGAMQAAEKRLSKICRKVNMTMQQVVRDRLANSREQRRQATQDYFSKVISTLPRAERQDWKNSREAWNKVYTDYYPDGAWPRYNLHNFRIRHSYIGEKRLAELYRVLEGAWSESRGGTYQRHFSRDFEPLFLLGMRMNRLLDETCIALRDADADTYSNKKAKKEGAQSVPWFSELRNEAAHGGMFWTIRNKNGDVLDSRGLFTTLFTAISKPHIAYPAERAGALKEKLHRLLSREDYVWVMPADCSHENPAPPVHIHNWTRRQRQLYSDRTKWRIDRRHAFRHLVRKWQVDLNCAFLEYKAAKKT